MLIPRSIGTNNRSPLITHPILIKLFLFLAYGLLAVCHGCTPDQATVCSASGLDSACYPKLDTLHNPLLRAHVKQINFFLETSGSMEGFMPANVKTTTDFQVLIPDILSRSQGNYQTNLYTIFDSESKFKKENVNNVITNVIPKGDFKWSGNTYVPVMLDSIQRYLDSDRVNIFISDCIYSPVSTNVKMTAQTIAEIREVVQPIAKNYATVIYMVKSTYFPKNSAAAQSPYYLIMQGKQENLVAVEQMIQKSLRTFHQNFEEIQFGDKYQLPYYSVLPYSQTTQNFVGSKNPKTATYTSLQDIETDVTHKVGFWVAIDLTGLPSFARTTDYLDSNLTATISKGTVKILKVGYKADKLNTDDNKFADKCDAFVQLSVEDMPEDMATVTLSLARKRPLWVAAINHDTLAIKETLRTKTFGWANIMTGFDQAYENSAAGAYFNQISISLIKKQ